MNRNTEIESEDKWKTLFVKISAENFQDNVDFLKSCGCFTQDWKDNLKHILHKKLNDGSNTYKNVQEMLRMNYFIKQSKMVLSDIPLLTVIPTNIKSLTHLKCLTLNEIDVHSLPESISSLINLNTLIVTKCPIYEIPTWISSLSQLNVLNFSRCRLHKVPVELAQCKRLDTLLLGYNFLDSVPSEVLELESVQRLSLDSNPINIQWNENMLPNCKLLSIGDTLIKTIPQKLVQRLIQLVWNDAENIQLPSDMGTSLVHLDISNDNLSQLPDTMWKLKDIHNLNTFGNPIENISKHFVKK